MLNTARGKLHLCYSERMARPRVHGKRVTTAVRLPAPLHGRLQEAAAERDLAANYLITRAIEEYLDRLTPLEELNLTRS